MRTIRRMCVVAVLIALGPTAAAAKIGPAPVPANRVGNVVLSSAQSGSPDSELAVLRTEQRAAQARGDRARVRAIEEQIQAIQVARQPRQVALIEPPRVLPTLPGGPDGDGPDVLIQAGNVAAMATDYEPDGTMWTVVSHPDSTAYLFKSTNHGESWWNVLSLNWGFVMTRLELVVDEGDSNFVHVFVIRPNNNGDLYDLRFNHDGTGMQTLGVRVGPDTVGDFAVAREVGPGPRFHYALVNNELRTAPPGRNAYFLRSGDYGRNWALLDSFTNIRQPHLSVGAGSWVYCATVPTPAHYPGVTARLTNRLYGSHDHWFESDVFPDTFEVSDPAIGTAFTLPESLAVVWCVWSHNYNNSGDWDVFADYSTNGGVTWSATYPLAFSTDYERWPDLKNFRAPGNTYMNASYVRISGANYRTVYRHHVNAGNPGGWSDTLRINEHSVATGREARPLLVYSPGSSGTGAGCVFAGEGLLNLYWNAPWMPGAMVEAGPTRESGLELTVEPSIGHGPFRIMKASRSAATTILDCTGRPVRKLAPDPGGGTVWDGRDAAGGYVAAGIYFVKVRTPEDQVTRKLIVR